jgi:hypothetical protein
MSLLLELLLVGPDFVRVMLLLVFLMCYNCSILHLASCAGDAC